MQHFTSLDCERRAGQLFCTQVCPDARELSHTKPYHTITNMAHKLAWIQVKCTIPYQAIPYHNKYSAQVGLNSRELRHTIPYHTTITNMAHKLA